ncbi:MAG: hypothetical protein AMJ79_00610 [Phycisphaerae bacterium SM23_30]|nr:MAG: hypothetical protein AMJ79_00610 [Phycisphaerae bacterium SM23_30]
MALIPTTQEDIAGTIAVMNRHQVQREIMSFSGRFRLDFTREYLQSQPVERLRHILLAARLQQRKSH